MFHNFIFIMDETSLVEILFFIIKIIDGVRVKRSISQSFSFL